MLDDIAGSPRRRQRFEPRAALLSCWRCRPHGPPSTPQDVEAIRSSPSEAPKNWVAVKALKLSYHTPETILLTIHPYCGTRVHP